MTLHYVNLTTERDTGSDGAERITLAGNVWRDAGLESGLITLICNQNGGVIRVTPEELELEFRPWGCRECGSYCGVDGCRICDTREALCSRCARPDETAQRLAAMEAN